MKETSLGLVPDLTGTKPLVECVGYARALEICTTARMVGARRGRRRRAGHRRRTRGGAGGDGGGPGRRPARGPSPGAVRETKALLLGAADRTLDEQRGFEREAQTRRFRELAALMGA